MRDILVTLAAAALICFTCDILLPDGELKRTARSIIALTILEALLYPVTAGILALGSGG